MKVTQSDATKTQTVPLLEERQAQLSWTPESFHTGADHWYKALKRDHLFLHIPQWKAQGPEISTQDFPVPPSVSQSELDCRRVHIKILDTPPSIFQLLVHPLKRPQNKTEQNTLPSKVLP